MRAAGAKSSSSAALAADVAKQEAMLAKLKAQKDALKSITLQSANEVQGQMTFWASSQGRTAPRSPKSLVEEAKQSALAATSVTSLNGRAPVAGSGLRAIAAAKQAAAAPAAAAPAAAAPAAATTKRALKPSAATTWSTAEVVQWLSLLGLDQYGPLAQQHALSGSAVVELGPADLDYMGVTALGHRKLLLKGVDQLRVACGMPVVGASAASSSAVAGESRAKEGGAKVHWSATVPTGPQQGKAAAGTGTASSSSLLDGEYDEAAEAAAFKAAVAAWRAGNKSSSTTAKPEDKGLASLGGGTWTNPFATDENSPPGTAAPPASLLEGSYDEEAERRAFQEAVAAWRQGGAGTGPSTAPAAKATDSTGSSASPGKSGAKSVCYNCYRQFYSSSGYDSGAGASESAKALAGKPFCSSSCWTTAVAAGDAVATRLQDGVARKLAESAPAARPAGQDRPEGKDGQDYDEEDGSGHSAGMDVDALTAAAEAAAIQAALDRVAALELGDEYRWPDGPDVAPGAVTSSGTVDLDRLDIEDYM